MTAADRNEPLASKQALEQAAHWWVTLHAESVLAAEELAFSEWIRRSPERVEAYLRTAMLLRALHAPDIRWPDTSAEVLIGKAKAAPPEPLALAERVQRRVAPDTGTRWLVPLALAGSFVVATVAAWWLIAAPQIYRTTIGEQRSVLLDDGSLVTLNTASGMEVEFSSNRRQIRLLQGEALFDVAHDAARPFDVETGSTTFRAVGTRFNVDRRAAHTTITVVEGKVAIIADDSAADSVLAAAQRLTVTDSHLGRPEPVANLAAATAWTQRRLIFERRPLAEVAAEFNRYNREPILIEDDKLRGEEVTAVFQANDTTAFVTFLAQIPGVEVHRAADGLHVVVAAERSAGVKTR